MSIYSFNNNLVSVTTLGAGALAVNKTNKAPSPRSLHLAYSPDKLYLPDYRAVPLIFSTSYLGPVSPSKLLLMGAQDLTAFQWEPERHISSVGSGICNNS